MDRPRVLTVLACLYVLWAGLFLLMAVPVSRMQEGYELFGTWVSARTYMYWFVVQGGVWAYLAYAFFQGLELGFFLYLALKLSHWGVTLLSGGLEGLAIPALALDALILGLVWREREWFRN